jgi:hypothetical protein
MLSSGHFAGNGQVGIGGQVAQVGFLGAHTPRQAIQVHVAGPEDVAFLGNNIFPQGIDNGLNFRINQSLCSQISHPLGIGGIGSTDGGVIVAGMMTPFSSKSITRRPTYL